MKNHMLSPTAPAARRRRPLGTTWGKSAAGGRQPPGGPPPPPFASLPPAQSHPDCRSRLILIVARQLPTVRAALLAVPERNEDPWLVEELWMREAVGIIGRGTHGGKSVLCPDLA